MGEGQEWSSSFWDCCSPCGTCFLAACCPCCIHGRTSSRLDDPTLKDDSMMNGGCCLYLLLSYCGLNFIPLMTKRGQIREKFGLEGSGCGDCMRACCCPCCTLMQHEKELESRAALLEGANGGGQGYKAPGGMEYR
ncbi:hypothetical protein AbraIFM66951_005625 [Aspergillus brasiliensis]|uniref:PLAC8-domain-containing protein n=1 Tax=Aspergillus brasiliensis TaxID=319629 RepID=A0A9W6DJB2_9EURO|nr:hypothetical protein AbraCBS73388_004174 [Aspergillus brasiliensis]GKZ38089.1 hypothetical protein AbraIFM66950_010036 [Aspergillus brasiliensis]GKZ51376.1 hypothetical protein AbraIFM66951_005625 [Aspergillus brasiliensis]